MKLEFNFFDIYDNQIQKCTITKKKIFFLEDLDYEKKPFKKTYKLFLSEVINYKLLKDVSKDLKAYINGNSRE